MNKNNLKPIIIFGSIILIYLVIMLIIFGVNKDNSNNKKPNQNNPTNNKPSNNNQTPINSDDQEDINTIIFIEDGAIITKSTDKWKNGNKSLILNKKFNIYNSSQLLGEFIAVYNDGWYIYDENNQEVNLDNKILGINTTKEFNRFNLEDEEITDEDKLIVSNYLETLNIKYNIDEVFISKNTSDYNKDGIRESLYTASYINGLDEESNYQEFSIAFIKFPKENLLIYNKSIDAKCGVSLTEHFELDNIKYVLFTCHYASDQGYELSLYSLNGSYTNLQLQTDFK